ncbi:MAG: hypothetical protein WCA44_14275 [Acidobacteriaceae bacterium]|jgi:hypothetical protein
MSDEKNSNARRRLANMAREEEDNPRASGPSWILMLLLIALGIVVAIVIAEAFIHPMLHPK